MGGRRQTHPLCSYGLLLAALFLWGCSEEVERVGKHRFRVPPENLIPESERPFFLPEPEEDGFSFLLNPTAARTEQRSVLVQEREMICARARGLKARVNSTICAPEEVEWRGRRWLRNGNETHWTYSPEMPSGSPAPFVSCFKMTIPDHPGLCSATLPADDLALTINLNADELPALEATYERAVSALRIWEE